MTVTAKTYVRIAGKLYAPGDTVLYNLPDVDRTLLVEKGAISVDDTTVIPEGEYGPEIVFTPVAEEVAEDEETKSDDADELDDIVAPVKKRSTRKKG